MGTFEQWVAGGRRSPISGHAIFHRQDGPPHGVPATLIHGYPTSSHDWELVLPALVTAGCRVTTLDLLGFGASDKPRGHEFQITEQASIVEALGDRLGIGETALVAHDYGVSVAQELLARNAERVTRVVWLNGGLYHDLYRPLPLQRLLHSPLGAVLAPLSTERTFRGAMRQILGRPVSVELLHEMWLAASAFGGKHVQHRLLRYIDERRYRGERWEAALESYSGPTLFVWGPADPVSGEHVLPRLRRRLPAASFDVLDQAPATGHYPQLENPEAVSEALTSFLTSQ